MSGVAVHGPIGFAHGAKAEVVGSTTQFAVEISHQVFGLVSQRYPLCPFTHLSTDALDARQERGLRSHLETCEGCRCYLEEISSVQEELTAAEIRSDIQASESFHQRVVGALRAEATGSAWETAAAQFRATWLNWRVALPLIGATVVFIVAWSIFLRRPGVPSPAPTDADAVLTPSVKSDLDPTIANYQMVANRSLEKLDELLTRQGNRNPSPTLIYTASALARANALD